MAGALVGLVAANALAGALPLVPGPVWYLLCIGAGVALTFRVWGWPLYSQLYRWARYALLHWLRPRTYDLDTASFYSVGAPETTPLLVPRPPAVPLPERVPARLPLLERAGKETIG